MSVRRVSGAAAPTQTSISNEEMRGEETRVLVPQAERTRSIEDVHMSAKQSAQCRVRVHGERENARERDTWLMVMEKARYAPQTPFINGEMRESYPIEKSERRDRAERKRPYKRKRGGAYQPKVRVRGAQLKKKERDACVAW